MFMLVNKAILVHLMLKDGTYHSVSTKYFESGETGESEYELRTTAERQHSIDGMGEDSLSNFLTQIYRL